MITLCAGRRPKIFIRERNVPAMPSTATYTKAKYPKEDRLIWKTLIGCSVVISTNVIGSYALSRGLRDTGPIQSWSPAPYIGAFVHPWVIVGVIFLIGWMLSRLALLSWADLSYILPINSLSYVLTAIVGAVLLGEHVTYLDWIGILLVTAGVALVGLTYPETTKPVEHHG